MSLEIVRGTIKNLIAMNSLITTLKNIRVEGTLYLGYPIIASADASHTIEALFLSQKYGLVVFTFPSQQDSIDSVKDIQDHIYIICLRGILKSTNL